MIEILPTRKSDDYWLELTKFAWLGQYVCGLLGGKDKVFEEMVKNDPSKERGEEKEPSPNSSLDEWREIAENKGLKYGK